MANAEKKVAFLTGISGQDGSYLTDLLLEKSYQVHGLLRRSSGSDNEQGWEGKNVFFHQGDLSDSTNLNRLIRQINPTEIYHLGAQSDVRSFDMPVYTADTSGVSTVRLLEAILTNGGSAKFYHASSSEMFGKTSQVPQNEKTPFHPRSPYGCAKVFAYWMTVNYREAYQLFACNGILYNHESPRRGHVFVTRKITSTLAQILKGETDELTLGNLESKRDWGYAKDYVQAMWLMLQQEKSDDYVVATGQTHTVRDFLEIAFGLVGLDYKKYVKTDPKHFVPAEEKTLVGDATKARKQLNWQPSVTFEELVRLMVIKDIERVGLNPKQFIVAL